eukprot:TRINITY_DN9385_c0_g1_i1.p2 TRINITY_DN9385_c0_g1~~TRINITY_DN9385_c0_g1_i1.p2  ORF type:complete len:156 (-),score=40.08 TRINITY_DN9385_c0_g1_i1:882-1349(-)
MAAMYGLVKGHAAAKEEFVEETLKPDGMQTEEYMRFTKRALTQQDLSKKQFSYKLSQSKDNHELLHLTWRIKLKPETADGFSVKGTIPLLHIDNPHNTILQFFDLLIDRQTTLEKGNAQLRDANDALKKQRGDAVTQLSVLVEEKKALELDLFQK